MAFVKNQEVPTMKARSFLLTVCFAVSLLASIAAGQCLRENYTPGRIYKTTGNSALDAMLNAEAGLLLSVFDVNPNMFLIDDCRGSGGNAYASPEHTVAGAYGTVYLGVCLIRDELWSMDKGGPAVAGIMAHEFAHILQIKKGSSLSSKYRELHADFLAGYYLGKKNYIQPQYVAGFAQSLYEKGDYNFRDPNHHGTPEERVIAMFAGFESAYRSASSAYRVGDEFVRGASTYSEDEEEDVYVTCPWCSGYGVTLVTQTCSVCGGTGYLVCATCMGSGVVYDFYGSPYWCTPCGGSGRLVCATCGGRGYVEEYRECPKCDGDGVVRRR